MANNSTTNNSWEKIQAGVKDTERLIGQKEYNSAMVKARQTLEFMVKTLATRADVSETGDLMETIDTLYQNRQISKTTCEHYHKIRMIGNKAAHEGDHNAYNANQSYHMLSQEVYTFASDYRNAQRGPSNRRPSSSSSGQPSRSRKRSSQRKPAFTFYDLLKLLIPVLCIVLLILVFKLVKPFGDKNPSETTAAVTTEATTEAPSTEPSTEVSPTVYKTTTTVNVRSEPNTDTDRLGKLESGVQVEFVRTHDNDWSIILYNGQEAYISSKYLTSE